MDLAGRHSFFVTCAPGLEPALHEEIRSLRLAKVERQVGGVYFEGTVRDAWRANLWLRTAVRVLLRLGRFQAPDEDALYRGAYDVAWEELLSPDGSLIVAARANDSQLTHSRYVEQRVKDAVVDRLRERTGRRPSVDKDDADLRIHVHLVKDRATLSIDSSGEPLHKRGWRRYQGRAPLAENLAAGVLLLSGWDGRAPLIDPFCSSGTLLVEAAMIADGFPPGGLGRAFAFESWPGHDAAQWARMRQEALAGVEPRRKVRLIGSDVDPERVEGAKENLVALELEERVELEVLDAGSFAPRPGWNAWIVSNLPYGERVGEVRRLAELHARFGERLREHCGGYHLALLTGRPELAHALAFPKARTVQLINGGLDCRLVLTEVPR